MFNQSAIQLTVKTSFLPTSLHPGNWNIIKSFPKDVAGCREGEWRKMVKRYKAPVVIQISTRDVNYNKMTTANSVV